MCGGATPDGKGYWLVASDVPSLPRTEIRPTPCTHEPRARSRRPPDRHLMTARPLPYNRLGVVIRAQVLAARRTATDRHRRQTAWTYGAMTSFVESDRALS
jgi:hypothetical protein